MVPDSEELKNQVKAEIDRCSPRLKELGKKIFENPELKFEEHRAMNWLAATLEDEGFSVERGAGGLETAFRARCPGSTDGPTIAYLSEYDALPGLGHACGHNLIANMGIGAGMGLCSVLDELDGEVLVIGTPAEEGGGGKVELIEAGLFQDVDIAMMAHPSDRTLVGQGSLGVQELKFDFHGRASHASSQPEEGINALDAVISTFNSVNALREHIKESSRIHGIITDGGEKPNIVPEHAGAHFYVRAEQSGDLDDLLEKVKNCAEAGALAAGSDLDITEAGRRYEPMRPNPVLADFLRENLEELEEDIEEVSGGMGSTDMGNVSQVVPAIHPYIKIAEAGTPAHSEEFAQAADSELGYEAMITAAKSLAMTGVDILSDRKNFDSVLEHFHAN